MAIDDIRNVPTTLYRAFDSSDRLLYVGIAVNWARRWGQHSERSPWFRQVTRIELTEYPNRADAIAAEKRVVQTEHPLHNIEHTPRDRRPMRQGGAERHYYVRPFDRRAFAHPDLLPRYRAVGVAINDLISVINAAELEMSQEDVAALVGDLVRVLPFADACDQCWEDVEDHFHYPVIVEVDGTSMTALYAHERCGKRWRTFWNVDTPWWMG